MPVDCIVESNVFEAKELYVLLYYTIIQGFQPQSNPINYVILLVCRSDKMLGNVDRSYIIHILLLHIYSYTLFYFFHFSY